MAPGKKFEDADLLAATRAVIARQEAGEVVGVADVAVMLGVSRPTVSARLTELRNQAKAGTLLDANGNKVSVADLKFKRGSHKARRRAQEREATIITE